jgi:hypothetical protein
MDKFLELMTKLRISAVYWVDDENAVSAELDLNKLTEAYVEALVNGKDADVKAAMSSFLAVSAHRRSANEILGIASGTEEDEASKFERILALLGPLLEKVEDPMKALVDGIKKLPGPLRGAEREALISLFQQDGQANWSWKPLSFTKWTQEGKTVLEAHSPEQPVLFVIDLQNGSEATAANGLSVLHDVAAAALDRKTCHLIVLTSECKTEEEFRKGRKLTEDYFTTGPSKRLPVFAMSKNRFANNTNEINVSMASAFSNVLQRADLSLTHLDFAEIMRQHFVDSIEITFNALDRVTIEELMYAVTHTSREEGVSEVETLVRLMNIAQRESFQQAIVESERLRSTILTLRAADLSIDRAQLESDKEIVKLRSAELYDKPEVINKLFSALSPGDIFLVQSKGPAPLVAEGTVAAEPAHLTELYVLVANACDLMMRSDGERHLDTGILLKLDEPSKGEGSFKFTLPHLEFTNVPGTTSKQIELRKYTSVPLSILDLCWTNEIGECIWSADLSKKDGNNLLKSQRFRIAAISAELLQLPVDEVLLHSTPLKAVCTIEKDDQGQLAKVTYGVRRVGRLSHAHAAQLNSRFTSVFGRPSAEHDFSKLA